MAYELIIRNETEEENVAKEVGGAGGINTPQNGAGNGGGGETSDEGANAEKLLKKVIGYQRIKSVATNAIGYQVSTVQLRTGSTEAQQRASFAYSVGMQAFNIGESIAVGAMTGGWIGAAIGAVLSVADTAMSYAYKQNTINIQKQLENTTQDITAQRATFSGSRYQNVTQ